MRRWVMRRRLAEDVDQTSIGLLGELDEFTHVSGCPNRAGAWQFSCKCDLIRQQRAASLVVHSSGLCTAICTHEPPDLGQVVVCRAWFRRAAFPRKSINKAHSSYGLKHAVERSTRMPGLAYEQIDREGRGWRADSIYVSNGAFIRAAILEGYRVVPCGTENPNAFFNLGIRKTPLPVEVFG